MKPSVGRIVHWTPKTDARDAGDGKGQPIAAMITVVHDDGVCSLELFGHWDFVGGSAYPLRVPFAETPTPGHWNWPPRV